jgi:serine/threonine protein kinase/tetratricopeptide (TPR) repeat protein
MMICPSCGRPAAAHAPDCANHAAVRIPTNEPRYARISDTAGVATIDVAVDTTIGSFPADPSPSGAATMLGADRSAAAAGSDVAAVGPLEVGHAFGPRYHIMSLLGLGGMGAVYRAWDAELGVTVALKVIRVDRDRRNASPELEKRFKNELLLARQVSHKNVVGIHDVGEIDGIKYITMPYVEGDDLLTLLRRDGKLGVARALRVMRQIVDGLQAAHEAGVVHRDLKPANVMINGSGDDVHALIMDFGISASSADASRGGVIGTFEYMAPEQAAGGTVDARADIYACGLILYEMLTGLRSAQGATLQERFDAMTRRFESGLTSIRTIEPSLSPPLDAIVAKCVQRDPAARFQTTAELAQALACLDDTGAVIPIPPRFGARLIAASVAVVIALVAATWWLTRTPPPVKPHDPVSVLIADLQNQTGDAGLDGTLEPVLKMGLESAGFITAFSRTQLRRDLGVVPTDRLDEVGAREIAVKQGLGVVLSGSIAPRGTGFRVSLKSTRAVTGDVIRAVEANASDRNHLLSIVTSLATTMRKALGDASSDAAQRFAMETLSATSLDVVGHYADAMEAVSNNRFDEARQSFSKAVELDPNFGLGYAGMAMMSRNLGQQEDAERYIKEAVRHVDRMTERERYRTRGLFYMVNSDYHACVKEYSDLLARFAGDATAHNNLALCSTQLRDMAKAVDEMRRVVSILPKRALYHVNLALYEAYDGDFQAGEQEARKAQELGSALGLLPLAFAQAAQGRIAEATTAYERLGEAGALGASFRAAGLGDLALYEGRLSDAIRILAAGADADLAAKSADRAAAKFAAIAYAEERRGDSRRAIAAADRALASSNAANTRFLAGRIYVESGAPERAERIAADLERDLLTESQAYGKILAANVALKSGDPRGAIRLLTEANALLDTWIGRFDLGRAYLAGGAFTQADSELERCIKRRGEALSLFLDEQPTFAYLPDVYYYQGRVREALNSVGFAESYRAYLNMRARTDEDVRVVDLRRRLAR